MDYVDTMRSFVQTVRHGTMSAAARESGLSVAVLSKRIADLERRLGTRLFNRTTRSMSLTDPGRAFLERATRILAEIDEAEAAMTGLQMQPKGELRISASVSFGRKHIAPIAARFLARYPDVRVHLQLTDQFVDLVDERLDIAIRIGELKDSSLIARRLARNLRVICATPDYFARHGTPRTPDDLAKHNCLVLNYPGSALTQWPVQDANGRRAITVTGNFESNNGEALTEALMLGMGLSFQSTWNVGNALKSGELKAVLTRYMVPDMSVYAVYPPARQVSAKVRAFIDAMVEALGPEPYWDEGIEHVIGH